MKIKFFAQAADLLGHSEINMEIDPDLTVDDIMRLLTEKTGVLLDKLYDLNNSQISVDFFILMNGVHLAGLQGTATKVRNDDVLSVIPVMEAG
jgi:molybdopterin converting factor small subunit